MSKHPDNPHWCQNHDQPKTIYRQDWDEALASGWVTPEHIAGRVRGIIQHYYGVHDGDSVAYDEEGFVSALTADGVNLGNGVTLRVFSGDHDPPHAHIEIPGLSMKRLTLNLVTLEIEQDLPSGWSKKGRRVEREARKRIKSLTELWNKNHGQTATTLDVADSPRTPD